MPKGSAIRTVADLKGKKVALNKGSNVHYLLVRALEKAGIDYKDVQTVFLPPADARASFERGAVDAWVIWDPFLAAAEKQLGARVLADGKGLVSNHQFYLAARPYAEAQPEIIRIVIEELAKVDGRLRRRRAGCRAASCRSRGPWRRRSGPWPCRASCGSACAPACGAR